jgi:hypothetical protein
MMDSRFHSITNRISVLSSKIGMALTLVSVFSITLGGIMTVNASRNEVSCFERGVVDGEDHPFNQRTYDNCDDDYYQGFLEGYMSVEGNNRDVCESATDA